MKYNKNLFSDIKSLHIDKITRTDTTITIFLPRSSVTYPFDTKFDCDQAYELLIEKIKEDLSVKV